MATKKSPDMVISDVMMLQMDGIALCNALKENIDTSHIAIILLTAKTSVESQLEGLNTGADDYLTKPFDMGVLQQKIKNILATRQNLIKKFNQQVNVNPSEITNTKPDELFIKNVVSSIEDNMANDKLDVAFLAGEMNMGVKTLYNKISSLTGKTVSEFIYSIRLKKAAQLFHHGHYNVAQVAYTTGFKKPFHFSRRFKEEFNVSPTSYIKKLKKP